MTGAIIQARLTSERLPGKMLKDICGKTMMQRVIERVKKAMLVEEVVVVIPHDKANRKLAKEALKYGPVHLGSTDRDVLGDYVQVASIAEWDFDTIVRITGDCPLIDPVTIDGVIMQHQLHRAMPIMYAITSFLEIDGLDTEVFDRKTLNWADEATRGPDRQHVTKRLYGKPDVVSEMLLGMEQVPDAKLSVDTQEDFDRIVEVYEQFGEDVTLDELFTRFGHIDNRRDRKPRNTTRQDAPRIWTP